jgi:hypothetical protein
MKKLLILFVAILGVSPAFAQSDEGADFGSFVKPKKSAFFIGPKAGVTMSSMTQPNECDLYDGSGIGFSGGIAMKARFGRATENSIEGTGMIGVGLELKYKQNAVKTVFGENLNLGYFELPVTLQFYPFLKSQAMNSFYLELGPSVGMLMSKSPDKLSVDINEPYPGTQTITYHTGGLKGFDVHPVFGLGYTIPNTGLDINARYYLGTSELAENFPCKMSTIEISISWLFKAAKF